MSDIDKAAFSAPRYRANAEVMLRLAAVDPFDAKNHFQRNADAPPPPAVDWAHGAARAVMADLLSRRVLKLDEKNEGLRESLVQSAAAIIRLADEIRQNTPERVKREPRYDHR